MIHTQIAPTEQADRLAIRELVHAGLEQPFVFGQCRQRARDELGVLDRHDENLITPLRRFAASRLRRDKPALHGPRLGANPHLT